MRNRQKAILNLLVLVVVLAAIALGVVTWLNNNQLRVIGTNPALNNFSSAVPFVDITFNKSLVKNSVSLSSNQNVIKSFSVNGKVVSVSLNPLQLNKTYTITIDSASSTDNKMLKGKILSFTTKYISPKDLPSDQQKAILRNQQNYTSPANDPIVSHLPHSTLDYILSAEVTTGASGQSTLILQAQILLAPGVSGAQATSETAQHEQEVVDYIHSLGLDPAKYNIQYQIVNESLTGV